MNHVNSSPMVGRAYEINRRSIFVMKLLGVGKEGLNLFCGLMDICQGVSNSLYYAALENIYTAAKAVFEFVTKKTVHEEKIRNEDYGNSTSELTVSGDGTWKKRSFTSLYGLVTLIGKYTGKVIDLVVKSSYCHACKLWESKCGTPGYETWIDDHIDQCSANHEGSAGKMEVDCVKEMFRRSKDLHGVIYWNYIGDGDAKTFKALLEDNPYPDEKIVNKKECVGHV